MEVPSGGGKWPVLSFRVTLWDRRGQGQQTRGCDGAWLGRKASQTLMSLPRIPGGRNLTRALSPQASAHWPSLGAARVSPTAPGGHGEQGWCHHWARALPHRPQHPQLGKYLQGPERVGQLRAELHVDVGVLVPGEQGRAFRGRDQAESKEPSWESGLGSGLWGHGA